MKRLIKYTFLFLITVSCSTIRYVPVVEKEYVTIKDTVKLHKTDTLIQIPEVSLADFIDVRDTLVLRASNATATAWVDTTFNALKGRLVQGGKLPVQVVEKERIVYRDSITTKEVPVEVEKPVPYTPKFWKFFGWIGMLSLVAAVLLILRKLKVF